MGTGDTHLEEWGRKGEGTCTVGVGEDEYVHK